MPAITLARTAFARAQALREDVLTLEERLVARKIVERAKSQLQQQLGIDESVTRAAEAGAMGYLVKPIHTVELMPAITLHGPPLLERRPFERTCSRLKNDWSLANRGTRQIATAATTRH